LLTPTQARQLEELVGAPFKFDENPTLERRPQP